MSVASTSAVPVPHIQRLTALKDRIEALTKVHHPDVLRILDKHGIIGSENKNGTFINLTCASEDVIDELESHISYVKEQEKQLSDVEEQKKQLATKYFTASRNPVKK
jgi:hypothetical protein